MSDIAAAGTPRLAGTTVKTRLVLLIQLLGTLAIIAWLPSNLGKTLALLVLWWATFTRLTRRELVFYVIVCLFFTGMDIGTVQAGQFMFDHPDVLGLPYFEPFMWGFFLLHTWRMLNGPVPQRVDWKTWLLTLLFAATFILAPNQTVLLAATAFILAVGLTMYRARLDWLYVAYMILLGAIVEYTGVFSGQWHYPGNPPTGVPLWFATMWGGIGLFLRRLMLPYVVGNRASS